LHNDDGFGSFDLSWWIINITKLTVGF
jgi:hypothetical protein